MRMLIVGASRATAALNERLEASGVEVDARAPDAGALDGPGEIAEIAVQLREFERVLGDRGPDAVLVASDSPAALAVVLVATKLGTPIARLDPGDERAVEGANARLIHQLADTAIAPDPVAIVAWARGGYPAR